MLKICLILSVTLVTFAVELQLSFHNNVECTDKPVGSASFTTEDCLISEDGLHQQLTVIGNEFQFCYFNSTTCKIESAINVCSSVNLGECIIAEKAPGVFYEATKWVLPDYHSDD